MWPGYEKPPRKSAFLLIGAVEIASTAPAMQSSTPATMYSPAALPHVAASIPISTGSWTFARL